MSDALLNRPEGGFFDFSIASDGDIRTVDFFDTTILTSIYEEKRASSTEVELPELRRGWIGNESTPNFERGSKVWLYSQSRLTGGILNKISAASNEGLQHLVDDGFAVSVQSIASQKNGEVKLNITTQRPNSVTERRELFLWDNSGITEAK